MLTEGERKIEIERRERERERERDRERERRECTSPRLVLCDVIKKIYGLFFVSVSLTVSLLTYNYFYVFLSLSIV